MRTLPSASTIRSGAIAPCARSPLWRWSSASASSTSFSTNTAAPIVMGRPPDAARASTSDRRVPPARSWTRVMEVRRPGARRMLRTVRKAGMSNLSRSHNRSLSANSNAGTELSSVRISRHSCVGRPCASRTNILSPRPSLKMKSSEGTIDESADTSTHGCAAEFVPCRDRQFQARNYDLHIIATYTAGHATTDL